MKEIQYTQKKEILNQKGEFKKNEYSDILFLQQNKITSIEPAKSNTDESSPEKSKLENQRITSNENNSAIKISALNIIKSDDKSNVFSTNDNLMKMKDNKYIKSSNTSMKETIRTFVIKNIKLVRNKMKLE